MPNTVTHEEIDAMDRITYRSRYWTVPAHRSPLTRRMVAAGIVATAVLAVGPAVAAATRTPDAPGTGRLVPCQVEGDNGCVWDAQHNGNGIGRSYIATPDGRVIYLPHYAAHALVYGAKAGA